MKKILLSSAAVLAFAGSAYADSKLSGDAGFEYNDEDGFDVDAGLSWAGSAMLHMGLEVSAGLDIDLGEDGTGGTGSFDTISVDASDWFIKLTNGTFSLNVGDVDTAQDMAWSGTTNMGADGFAEKGDGDEDFVITAGAMFGGTNLYVSTLGDNTDGSTSGNSLGLKSDLGGVTITAAWQDYSDAPTAGDQIWGISAATALAGVDVKLAHANNDTSGETSTGVSVSYPIGSTTVGAFYSVESAAGGDNYGVSVDHDAGDLDISAWFHDGGDEDFGVDIAYVMGDLSILAGTSGDEGSYAGAIYDLGSGASVAVYWADDIGFDNPSDDEVGPEDWQNGATIEFGYSFTM